MQSPEQAQTKKIYLSYAKEDSRIAGDLTLRLANLGYNVLFSRTDTLANWRSSARIEKEIDSSDLFIFLITPESVSSQWIQVELDFAIRRMESVNPFILPVLLRPIPTEKAPPAIRSIQFLDIASIFPEGGVAIVVQAIIDLLEGFSASEKDSPSENRSADGNSKTPILIPDIDWVEIPAGEFLYGDEETERLHLDDYFISRYPITNSQYHTFINPVLKYPTQRIEWKGVKSSS